MNDGIYRPPIVVEAKSRYASHIGGLREDEGDLQNELKFIEAFNASTNRVSAKKIDYKCYFVDIAVMCDKRIKGLIEFRQKFGAMTYPAVWLDLNKLLSLRAAHEATGVYIYYVIENSTGDYHIHKLRKGIYEDLRLGGNPNRNFDIHPAVLIPAKEFMSLPDFLTESGFR